MTARGRTQAGVAGRLGAGRRGAGRHGTGKRGAGRHGAGRRGARCGGPTAAHVAHLVPDEGGDRWVPGTNAKAENLPTYFQC